MMARSRCLPANKRTVICCFVVYLLSVLHLGMRLDMSQGISRFTEVSNISARRLKERSRIWASEYVLSKDEPPWMRSYRENLTRFRVSESVLRAMEFPLKRYVTLDKETISQFVFVTAASNPFASGVLRAIASAQKYYPGRRILFYDLGLSSHNKEKLLRLCDVEYRVFDFSKYPKHVEHLKSYTWKPLIIYEVLKEHPGVFWMDSSVRLLSGNFSVTHSMLFATDGILLFNFAGHNTFVVTHKTMYEYLPTNLTEMQRIYQYEANTMVIFATRTVFNDVIKWWVLCALVERCMAPVYAVACRKTPPDVYAGCHRYDQSAINILLANKFNFNYAAYAKHYDNFEVIRRHSTDKSVPRICPTMKPKAR